MLGALLRAGFDARGLDIRPASEFGTLPVTTDTADFYKGLVTLITVVRDIDQTEAVLFQTDAPAVDAAHLETIIISSTLSPRYVKELRNRVPAHIVLIDAPMSGAEVKAKDASLSFMLGGTDAHLDKHQPLFDAMGAHFHRMGAHGAGMQAKVLNNMLAASHTAMTRLVLDWADKTDIDKTRLLDLIHTSSGQNWLASGFTEIEFARKGYSTENSLGILKKDVEAALDAAPQNADTRLPELLTQMIHQLTPRS
ncbi:NAD(P)-binding domain-containing protein [Litoreibacter sp.]|nr:NAD(P)-binding domain-containing protein [Litoreibacter sp.]